MRLRDSQCGLFATGKVLRRFGVPFTYMTNCRLTDPEFERGIQDFLAVCNVVDTFRHTRILQIGPRPFDFWSTMCNEGELLQHCGPWPISVAQEKPTIGYPLAFSHPGAVEAQAKLGEMTLARLDGDNGEYSLLLGNAKGVEGPYTKGTYVWVEVQNLKRLEAKIVEGPYIHHCVGIHENVVPVLYEACKYIGIAPDLYDPIEEDVKAYLRGE